MHGCSNTEGYACMAVAEGWHDSSLPQTPHTHTLAHPVCRVRSLMSFWSRLPEWARTTVRNRFAASSTAPPIPSCQSCRCLAGKRMGAR